MSSRSLNGSGQDRFTASGTPWAAPPCCLPNETCRGVLLALPVRTDHLPRRLLHRRPERDGRCRAAPARRRVRTRVPRSCTATPSRPPFNQVHAGFLAGYVDNGFADQPDGTRPFEVPSRGRSPGVRERSRCQAQRRASTSTTPVVVAVGHDEPGSNPARMGPPLAEALDRGQLIRYEHIGHFGPLQDPWTVARDIRQHVDRPLAGNDRDDRLLARTPSLRWGHVSGADQPLAQSCRGVHVVPDGFPVRQHRAPPRVAEPSHDQGLAGPPCARAAVHPPGGGAHHRHGHTLLPTGGRRVRRSIPSSPC